MEVKFGIKSIIIALGLLGIVSMSGFAVMGLSKSEDHKKEALENPVRLVKAETLLYMPTHETRSFPGVVKAAKESKLAFRVGGPLIAFDVNIGQKVKKGDVLAKIDPRDYQVRILRLEAALKEAGAMLKAMRKGARIEDIALLESEREAVGAQLYEAELNFKRFQVLHDQKAASTSAFDRAKTAYDVAKSRETAAEKSIEKARKGARSEEIEAMEARIKGLEADLMAAGNAFEDTQLKAPFDGVVNKKFVENFESVNPGKTVISLFDFRHVEITVAIPEDMVLIRDTFSRYYCKLSAQPETIFDAEFKEIGLNATDAHQSYPLTITMKLPEHVTVHPGMAADVFIDIAMNNQSQKGLLAPVESVFSDASGRSCVWKINPENMTVNKCVVKQGDLFGNLIEFDSGLNEKDLIVTAGARFLREGEKVRIMK